MVKTKTIVIGVSGLTTISLIFAFLILNFNFQITDLTGNITCSGTIKDPCISEFNVYNPGIYNVALQGSNSMISFSPSIKSYKIYFNGKLANLSANKTIVTFKSKTNTTVKIVGYKNSPKDTVKWSFISGKGTLDPYWYGDCNPPSSGDWTLINTNCTFNGDFINSSAQIYLINSTLTIGEQ